MKFEESIILCPVCSLPFNNKYCLSNHFLNRGNNKFLDDKHKLYWIENKKKKKELHKQQLLNKTYERICTRCDIKFIVDFEHKFQKKCNICREKYPAKKPKKHYDQTKQWPCYKCGKIIEVKLLSTNKVCDECKSKRIEDKRNKILSKPLISNCKICGEQIIKYKQKVHDNGARGICNACKNDTIWFRKHKKYDDVINLLSTTDLIRKEINIILNLDYDFVREAAIDKFGNDWYKNRLKELRKFKNKKISISCNLFYDELRKNKDKFDEFFIKRNFNFNPSSLEFKFIENLNNKFEIETNQWLTLEINNQYERREIDLKVKLNNEKKFAILIDGEAFHGPNTKECFKAPTVEHDSLIALTLANMGYFSIRYSETEVKSGWANHHFLQKFDEFSKIIPIFYYRNWMTNEETIIH